MDELDFLKHLAQKNVLFVSNSSTGKRFMEPEEILEWVKDPMGYEASCYGVPTEIYLGWIYRGCSAKTRRGTICQIHSVDWPEHPKDFIPGISDRCHVHLGK